MSRGTRPIAWLWSFFSGKPQGEAYELLQTVQPSIDVTNDWPPQLKVFNGDFISGSGTQTIALPNSSANPTSWTTGRQRLWLNLGVTCTPQAPGPASCILSYEANQQASQRANLVHRASISSFAAGVVIPLIGATSATTAPANFTSLARAFSADPDRLILFMTGMAGGESITIRGLYVERGIYDPLPLDLSFL